MSLQTPDALWGLAALPLLFLLARWRRRPRARVWPSLLVWKAVLAQREPVPRRRGIDPLLWLECAAVLLCSLAAAAPVLVVDHEAVRVVVLSDTGQAMEARRGTETVAAATRREVQRILDDLARPSAIEWRDVADPFTAAAALRETDLLIVASNRPGLERLAQRPERPHLVVGFAPTGHNTGIDAVEVDGEKLWFALATDGPPRKVRVSVGGRELTLQTGAGHTVPFAGEIALLERDNYAADDRVLLERIRLAIREETGSRFVRAAIFQSGLPARPVQPDDAAALVVTGAGGSEVRETVYGRDCVAGPGPFDGLSLEGCVWRGARAREGEGLLHWRGRALARQEDRTLWIGLPLDSDWDDFGTLAVFFERVKRQAAEHEAQGRGIAGHAFAEPRPRFVDTSGVDRPWDGALPARASLRPVEVALRAPLALLAALILGFYLRAIVRSRS